MFKTFLLVFFILLPASHIWALEKKLIAASEQTLSLKQAEQKYQQLPWESFARALHVNKLSNEIETAEISLLKGGFSSSGLFKLSLSEEDYVLRFMGDNHSLDQHKIITQSFVWAGANGVGPQNYLIDNKNFAFLLSEFIEGRVLKLQDTKSKKILRELGSMLFRVHNIPPPKTDYQEFTQFTHGQKWYEAGAKSGKVIGPSILKEAYKHWLEINNEVTEKPTKAMLHNDPNLRNIMLHNNKITLIDWELTGIGDPRKEVAHVCAWYGLNNELTRVFLNAYYGREPTNQELSILQKLRIQILLEFAWVGLSTLKADLDQRTWDKYYEQAHLSTVEDLSIIQMQSESKPSDEVTRSIFLGLIKEFMIEVNKK